MTAVLPWSFLIIVFLRCCWSWNSPAPVLHARSLESQHRLNDLPRIKFLWRAPKSRAHLDCPTQGRASAFGHIGPAPSWSAWQGARNRRYISAFLQGSQGHHRSRRAYVRRSLRAALATPSYLEQQSTLGASADRETLTDGGERRCRRHHPLRSNRWTEREGRLC